MNHHIKAIIYNSLKTAQGLGHRFGNRSTISTSRLEGRQVHSLECESCGRSVVVLSRVGSSSGQSVGSASGSKCEV